MSEELQPHSCGCGGDLREIRIIDRQYTADAILSYTAADSVRSRWRGIFPVEGRVASMMCQSCGRIELFGVAGDAS